MTIAVAVAGATGRLGSQIARLVEAAEDLHLHAAMDSSTPLESMQGADVLVDATHYEASKTLVRYALENGIDTVIATSGWHADRIASLSNDLPEGRSVLVVPNFSVGSVVASHIASIAGQHFDSIEIIEAHHEHKVDSPSGTAVRTAEGIASARNTPVAANNVDQDARGQVVAGIPIHSLRLRGVVADQQVILGGVGETVTIRHETLSPSAYDLGIGLAIRRVSARPGITVGLGELLGLWTVSGTAAGGTTKESV
ncbi:4-hydroxy-tetrahydrodipicolinate reductase [Gulosibacter bifidus]|uniref:4-hydroxy-tetrahydrodipicolinate reductase n=1 Tax=Gulosibacter bifidus TaxID=272239 RepID=A0ABW5RFZ5_9MICO|nr:4-hydroxy-tetrahydrodipicolinate reductase [Gulosibacter bifidus]